jgi:hypothetical protein
MRKTLTALLGATAVVALVSSFALAGSASAGRVAWNEAAKAEGKNVMTYKVDTLTFGKTGWQAHISFHNVSHTTIGMSPKREFGAAFFTDPKTETLSGAVGFASATMFSSKLPTSLKPGDSWTGTIGGRGTLSTKQKIYVRVVFGPFSHLPGTTTEVVWITDHSMTLGATQPVVTPPAGPVI